MHLRSLSATLALAVGLSLASVHAQVVDPCTIYTCMAGISGAGASGGPGCLPALAFWHATAPAGLAVYDWTGFDAPASAALRQTYMMLCPGAQFSTNAALLSAIIAEWGSLP